MSERTERTWIAPAVDPDSDWWKNVGTMDSPGVINITGDIVEGFGGGPIITEGLLDSIRIAKLTGFYQSRRWITGQPSRGAAERVTRLMSGLAPERCDNSWLWPEQCAHCLGHTLPDDVPVQQS